MVPPQSPPEKPITSVCPSNLSDTEFTIFKDNVIQDLKTKGFLTDNTVLHSDKSCLFYKEILNANQTVINLLEKGHTPQFKFNRPPPSQHLRNNKSVQTNMDIVRRQIFSWVQSGVVKQVQNKPYTISPLHLVSKINSEGQLKHRVCLDLKRTINPAVVDRSVSLEDIPQVLSR